ncbi:MAG TPA: YbaB/EbfC family nucleoid-associated protein [bacterium]|nr:YbaB/EbfC family nucleoid-associated protein [bacterium]HPV65545.1 YbaB/EbfC family nucleoid-associated protein [bacterium]
MFNKLKQLKDLRSQAKTMQNALAGEKVEVEKNGIKLSMNGNMEVMDLVITSELSKEEIARTSKELFNDAIKKTQRIMAKKMQEMGGFPGLN